MNSIIYCVYVYVYIQIYIRAYTAMKADRRDAATQEVQSYGAVRSFGLMRHLARSCADFILLPVHSFYLLRWMTSAVFREEPSLRVGPLLVFLVGCFLVFFFPFVCLVGFFVFLSLVLSASPLVFLGWWSCHLKSIYYIIRSNFYFEVA